MQLRTHLAPGPFSLGLVALAHFANDAVTNFLPALLPLLALRFELAAPELALLVSIFAVSTSLPQPFFGMVADRLGPHRVGALGLGVSAALVAALSLVPSAPWLGLVLLLGGLGSSALHPAGAGLARASIQRSGLGVALFSAAGMAGGAFGPLVALGVTSTWGLEGLAWAAAPVLLVAALLGASSRAPQRAARHELQAPRPRFHLLRGPVARLAVVALAANLVLLAFTSAVPVWLVSERGLPETSPIIGLTLATFSMAAAVGGILGGALVRWVRPSRLIVGSLALSVVALESVLLTTPGSVTYLVAVAAAGALLYLHGPLLMVRAQALSPGSESAVAGVLWGGTSAVAGVLYAGLGAAQSVFGIGGTLAAIFLVVLPAARVAASVLRSGDPEGAGTVESALSACSRVSFCGHHGCGRAPLMQAA